jgi:hypothetical protein
MSSLIFQDLDEIFLKGYIKMEGTHENKGSTHVEQTVNNKPFQLMNLNIIVELIMVGVLNLTFPKLN